MAAAAGSTRARTTPAPAIDDPWGLVRAEVAPPRPVAARVVPVVTATSTPMPAPTVVPFVSRVVAHVTASAPAAAAPHRTWWLAVATAMVMVGLAAFAAGRESWRASAPDAPALGMLVVSSHPSGAHVTVDGQPQGATPLAVRVGTGVRAVVVTDAAGASEQFTAEVTAGVSAARHVAFAPIPPAAAPSQPGPPTRKRVNLRK